MKYVKFNCARCSQSIEAPIEMANQLTACPTCGKIIIIPMPMPATSEAHKKVFIPLSAVSKDTSQDQSKENININSINPHPLPFSRTTNSNHDAVIGALALAALFGFGVYMIYSYIDGKSQARRRMQEQAQYQVEEKKRLERFAYYAQQRQTAEEQEKVEAIRQADAKVERDKAEALRSEHQKQLQQLRDLYEQQKRRAEQERQRLAMEIDELKSNQYRQNIQNSLNVAAYDLESSRRRKETLENQLNALNREINSLNSYSSVNSYSSYLPSYPTAGMLSPFDTKSTYKYKGISGQQYKYDLSNPMDAMKYEMDIMAQLHDDLKASKMKVQSDRDFGQYGAGIR